LTAVSATATSGDASLAIDGYNDSIKGVNNTMHSNKGESLWTSTGALPQSITLNLGKSYDNIDMLEYLPQRHTGTTAGNITSYKVFVSKDNVTFTQVASGTGQRTRRTTAFSARSGYSFPRRARNTCAWKPTQSVAAEPARSPAKLRSAPPARREQQARAAAAAQAATAAPGARAVVRVQGAVGVLAVPLAAGVPVEDPVEVRPLALVGVVGA